MEKPEKYTDGTSSREYNIASEDELHERADNLQKENTRLTEALRVARNNLKEIGAISYGEINGEYVREWLIKVVNTAGDSLQAIEKIMGDGDE
jgi:hypothetical protein